MRHSRNAVCENILKNYEKIVPCKHPGLLLIEATVKVS